MSSISGLTSLLTTQASSTSTELRSRPDPEEKFNELDSDGSGTLDTVELSAMAQEMSERSGTEIDVEDSIATYDVDGDGELSQDEMDTMMQELGPPPQQQEMNSAVWQAMQSYLENSESSESSLLSMFSESEEIAPPMGPPPPDPEEKFTEFDSDSSDGLNAEELQELSDDFFAATGTSIDVDDAMESYDEDGDGELSQSEMDTMMQALRGDNESPQISTDVDLQELAEQYSSASDEERLALLQQLFGNSGLFTG